MTQKKELITWGKLSELYNLCSGSQKKADTLPVDTILNWAYSRTDMFERGSHGGIYLKDFVS